MVVQLKFESIYLVCYLNLYTVHLIIIYRQVVEKIDLYRNTEKIKNIDTYKQLGETIQQQQLTTAYHFSLQIRFCLQNSLSKN